MEHEAVIFRQGKKVAKYFFNIAKNIIFYDVYEPPRRG